MTCLQILNANLRLSSCLSEGFLFVTTLNFLLNNILFRLCVKKELPKTRNRGIKQAGFHVLVGASMPNLLIEVGFLTNKAEARLLNKSSYRAQLAQAIFEGIQNYVEFHNN